MNELDPHSEPPVAPTRSAALRVWWRIGWLSFGGPAAQIALMHAELVERRRWVDEGGFVHGLNYCMLLPGPEAMQLACYLGWRLHGVAGGLAAGALFVLPGALLMGVLAWLYVAFGTIAGVDGALLGLKAAVLGLVAHAVWRLGRRVLRTPFAIVIAAGALLALTLGVPFPLLILIAALAGAVGRRLLPTVAAHGGFAAVMPRDRVRPRVGASMALAVALLAAWWLPLLALPLLFGSDSTAWAMALFFSWAALVTFGGAYAVLPYVAIQAVETHAWIAPGQMLVGLGLAETTPGPLILVLEFVGFVGGWQNPDVASPLVAALIGAAVTLWATFLPSFLFVLPAAPWIDRLRDVPLLSAALGGITAAVVGVIASLGLWFAMQLLRGQHAATVGFVLVVATAMLLLLQRGRMPLPALVVGAGGLGAAWAFIIH
jgi:chromate transporter